MPSLSGELGRGLREGLRRDGGIQGDVNLFVLQTNSSEQDGVMSRVTI